MAFSYSGLKSLLRNESKWLNGFLKNFYIPGELIFLGPGSVDVSGKLSV